MAILFQKGLMDLVVKIDNKNILVSNQMNESQIKKIRRNN